MLRGCYEETASVEFKLYRVVDVVKMYSAGSLAPPRVIRSLSNDQALQVVSNSYFDDDDTDAVCSIF